MSNGIVNGAAKAVPDAIKGWGIYSLIAFFMVGVYFYMTESRKESNELVLKLVDAKVAQTVAVTDLCAIKLQSVEKVVRGTYERQSNFLPTINTLMGLLTTALKHSVDVIKETPKKPEPAQRNHQLNVSP